MEHLTVEDIKSVIYEIKTIIDREKETLTRLDSLMGDGDLGITMSRAFTAAYEEAVKSDEITAGKLLAKLGMVMAKTSPSTMGTLLATGFMKGGKAIETTTQVGTEELAVFFEAFVKGIMDRGKSVPGNKTIVDVLYPATVALRQAADLKKPLAVEISDAQTAAMNGLEASTQMKAQYGRAAYYQDDSIGKQDGGATVGTFIFQGFYQYIFKTRSDFYP
jgi:dihydroxyacetone kinase-like protein